MSTWRTDLVRRVFRVSQQVNNWHVTQIEKVVYRVRVNSSGGVHDHTQLTNIGVNTHVQIDTHLASTANPHSVTAIQVGALTDAPSDGNQYARKDGAWDIVSGGGAVDSVNGQVGVVVLDTDDIAEGVANLYYTEGRVSANTDVAANSIHSALATGNPHFVNKIDVGLGAVANVLQIRDELSSFTTHFIYGAPVTNATILYEAFTGQLRRCSLNDLPVSSAIQTALDAKLAKTSDLSDVADQQTALNNITAVAVATNEYVLTKDTVTGDAVWKAAAGSVNSVNGKTGVVVLTTSDIAEGTNLYYTEGRVSANADVSANTTDRHTHANSVVLAAIMAAGSGSIITFAERSAITAIPTAGVAGQVLTKIDGTDYNTQWATPAVTGVFGRTGAVVAQANDYTWAQINKTVSDIADLTTKSHTSLTDIGVNTHAQIDTHVALVNEHIDWTNATDNLSTVGSITSVRNTDSAGSMIVADLNLPLTGFPSTVHKCIDIQADIDIAAGALPLGSVCNLYSRLNIVDNGSLGSTFKACLVDSQVDMGGFATNSATPVVSYKLLNPATVQTFTNGFFRVEVQSGTGAGETIALFSVTNAQGAATGIGYKGYAASDSTATGDLIGVQGVIVPNSTAAHSSLVAIDGLISGGGGVPADKRLGLRANAHALVRNGSIAIVVTPSILTLNGVTTDHLDFVNNQGEAYFEGNTEVDGELFCDGSESHSLVETTTTPYTASTVTYIMVDATAGNKIVDLPAISGLSGNREYVVKKIDSSANTVTVDGNSSETIDGATTVVLSSQYDKLRIIAGGTEWHDVT